MKAIRTKNRIKAFAVFVAACLALILSTVFTFGYDHSVPASATARAADGETGIRFVQVAAGSDFAIGLTYDGRLFGWSIDNDNDNTELTPGATSLGGYYTKTPTEIPVKFRQGPGKADVRYDWTDNPNDYHKEVSGDRITSIAATSTTAAFITNDGYIYTWGLDGTKDVKDAYNQNGINNSDPASYRYLLLRPYDTTGRQAHWYEPYIIDYNYLEDAVPSGSTKDHTGLYHLAPRGQTFDDMSIAGGENNYIVVYKNNGQDAYYSYVWGSVMYNALQSHSYGISAYYDFENGSTSLYNIGDSYMYRDLYKTQYYTGGSTGSGITIPTNGSVKAVAGGYTVGMNASEVSGSGNVTSLTLKGKNFITSAGLTVDSSASNTLIPVTTIKANANDYTAGTGGLEGQSRYPVVDGKYKNIDGLSDIKFGSAPYVVKGAIAGGFYAVQSRSDSDEHATPGIIESEPAKADLYYARQAIAATGGATRIYNVTQVNAGTENSNVSGIYGSDGVPLSNATVQASIIRNAVSLGNDIGYGISGGYLYSWGDNFNGQLGLGAPTSTTMYKQYPTEILNGKGTFVSVAAGKQASPSIAHKAFNDADTLGAATGDAYAFNTDVWNDSKYITGAITSSGKLFVWSDSHNTPTEIVFGLTNDNSSNSVSDGQISEYNKFVAVYSGYGRNLFAITKLGKLVRITCSDASAAGNDGVFSQEIYDYFRVITNKGETAYNNGTYERSYVTNWTVDSSSITANNTTQKSLITFTIANADQPTKSNVDNRNPDIGAITLFVNDALPTKTSVKLNGEDPSSTTTPGAEGEQDIVTVDPMKYTARARQSLVSTNKVGDVYRILVEGDESIQYVHAREGITVTGPTSRIASSSPLSKAEIAPKFSYKAKATGSQWEVMDEDQWKLMFDYEIVQDYDTGDGEDHFGVGIKIIPKRSTQNGTVNMRFYVARFSCAEDPDTALYYDHIECNVEFTIENSTVVRMYNSYNQDNPAPADPQNPDVILGKSNIPLLDPNNAYNKYYSLAVHDVSTGFDRLADFISSSNKTTLVNKIKAYVTGQKEGGSLSTSTITWDPGFPDSQKVTDGNLKYYLGDNAGSLWYDNKYKYLFKDRDLDIVRLNVVEQNLPNTAISGASKTVSVKLEDLASLHIDINHIIDTDNSESLQDYINKCFENVYGFMDIKITAGEDANASYVDVIEFSYDILLFTANGTTGKLDYESTTITDAEGERTILANSVDAFNTVNSEKNNVLTYKFSYDEYVTFNPNFTTKIEGAATGDKKGSGGPWQDAVSVFSQASVRLKDSYKVNGNVVYGASSTSATAHGLTANNHYEVVNNNESGSLVIGGSDIVINLTDYVQTPGNYIKFSFENQHSDYKGFDNQFVDSISNTKYVTLSGEQIKVKLLTSKIYFTVTIQRFFGVPEGYFANGDERITISFVYTNIRSIAFSEDTSSRRTFSLSHTQRFYVFGANATEDSVGSQALVNLPQNHRSKMELTGLTSSNHAIVDPRKESNEVIRLIPGESGTAVVQFVLTAYGKSIPITLTFNVSGITTIKDRDASGEIDYTVNLSDSQYVYISTLDTGLRNSATDDIDIDEFGVLYGDTVTLEDGRVMYNAVEFELIGNSTAGENEYFPPFVKSISFHDTTTDKAYLRFDIDSDASSVDLQKQYMVYVKFVNTKNNSYKTYAEAQGDTIIRAAFKLKANKKVAFEGGSMLEIVADVDNPKKKNEQESNIDWYMIGENLEAKIYVPLRYICERAGILNYKDYEIFLISAAEGSANYINAVGGSTSTKDVIEITPIYETVTPITLNVSIKHTSKGASENQVVAFSISIKGISTTLSKDYYVTIWLVAFFSSLGFLMIIFLIRMIVYWRRRAKQRALIKRNQELIKMRDKVHNKASSATRDQAIRTKLKLQDPKYAKMFNEMKKDQNGGVDVATVGGSGFGEAPDASSGKKAKKKKGGKKSMAELKAELAAKKAAFAQAQNGTVVEPMTFGAQPVNPFGDMSGDGFGAPGGDFGGPAPDFGAPGPDFGAPNDVYNSPDLGGNEIIFDAPDIDGQSQG